MPTAGNGPSSKTVASPGPGREMSPQVPVSKSIRAVVLALLSSRVTGSQGQRYAQLPHEPVADRLGGFASWRVETGRRPREPTGDGP